MDHQCIYFDMCILDYDWWLYNLCFDRIHQDMVTHISGFYTSYLLDILYSQHIQVCNLEVNLDNLAYMNIDFDHLKFYIGCSVHMVMVDKDLMEYLVDLK